ncbi:MAG: transferase hexapeptide repeat family protein, partial [Deltaproteobacteria bacterium]|nr:transferase hexapeptide repeat family protein [Deltaproteobacteria bacterium]
IIGDVIIGAGCYIGPCASLRGDFGRIVLQDGVNVQDSCTLHSFPGKIMLVESDGHVGHGAILHGCIVKRGVLIGMNAVVMDGAVVHDYAFVGACAFVKARFEVPPRHLAVGNPAEVVRELSAKELLWKEKGTRLYQRLAQRSLRSLKSVEALSSVENDRKIISWDDEDLLAPLYELNNRKQ